MSTPSGPGPAAPGRSEATRRWTAEPFLGTFGVAPSYALLTEITLCEQVLLDTGGVALPPDPAEALPADAEVARTGLRTMPPRENAGNIDIRQTGVGTRLLLLVSAPDGLFSAGDGHYGEGEACGIAIEMTGTWRLPFDLRKGAAAASGQRRLRFERAGAAPAPIAAEAGPYFATTGISVDAAGINHGEDVTVAARDALREMIDRLVVERGFTPSRPTRCAAWPYSCGSARCPTSSTPPSPRLLPLGIFDQS